MSAAASRVRTKGDEDGVGPSKKHARRTPPIRSAQIEEAPDLRVECRYRNDLPAPPVPKLLRALPNVEKLARYKPTALEIDHRPILLTEQDLLSLVEFVDVDAYGEPPAQGSMPPPLLKTDAVLLRDDDLSAAEGLAEQKKLRLTESTEAFHREAFGLQLPQLITNDIFTERQRFITGMQATEKKIHREPPDQLTMDDVVDRVEKTFDQAREAPVHPTDPTQKPRRVMPIVPDAVLWGNKYRLVNFDELPGPPKEYDLLLKSTPHPRTTTFSYFKPVEGAPETFDCVQDYVFNNRGAFTDMRDRGEGKTLLMSIPPQDSEVNECRFMLAPNLMSMKKQKSVRLDIQLEMRHLTTSYREPTAQEQKEEHDRMAPVLSDETADEYASQQFEFVDGEWVIKGSSGDLSSSRIRSHPSASGDASHLGSPAVGPLPVPARSPQVSLPPPSPLPHAALAMSPLPHAAPPSSPLA